jgi:predicted nucleotidyltransferase
LQSTDAIRYMPTRSLHSSVLRWPDRATVHTAAAAWAQAQRRRRADIVRVGYFGSYATGRWGVGSDLDLVVVVETSDEPFDRRAVSWDLHDLPVSADLLVYTKSEWNRLLQTPGGFQRHLERDTIWL